jgi:hypothetical protein
VPGYAIDHILRLKEESERLAREQEERYRDNEDDRKTAQEEGSLTQEDKKQEEAERLRDLINKGRVRRNAIKEDWYQLQEKYNKTETEYFGSENPTKE